MPAFVEPTFTDEQTKSVSRLVEGVGEFYDSFALAGSRDHADRCDGDPFVDDRDSVLLFDVLACLYEILGAAADFVINLCARLVDVLVNAVEKRDTHGDSSHVKVLVIDHIDSFQYISCF